MKRVDADEQWTLMCPNEAKGLYDCFGEEYEHLYTKYEQDQSKVRGRIQARALWERILDAQTEAGVPYMLFKDPCNLKSNQKNLGTIRSSNLCTEIVQYTSPDEVAVCNLSSIALPKFVKGVDDGGGKDTVANLRFDHKELFDVVYHVTRSLNSIIDRNFYPVKEARTSNTRHRPIGLGVQGLADAFILMRYPFESKEAATLNREIFETIYYAALCSSCDLAKEKGKTYKTYPGSPSSKGILQYDMWRVTPSPRWNWTGLKHLIAQHGLYNSLLVAPMPTASTAQILGNNECFEPYTSNVFTRKVLAGEFTVLNKHLFKDLQKLGLLTPEITNQIIADGGSVQRILELPDDLRALYKTVWEMDGRTLIDMAADRGAFIDQSQSMNCFMAHPTHEKLTAMHFYAWKKGLKTGMYYLRAQARVQPIQFTVDRRRLRGLGGVPVVAQSPKEVTKTAAEEAEEEICRMEEGCVKCSS